MGKSKERVDTEGGIGFREGDDGGEGSHRSVLENGNLALLCTSFPTLTGPRDAVCKGAFCEMGSLMFSCLGPEVRA